MSLITRRGFLSSVGLAVGGSLAFTGYATAYETGSALVVTRYDVRPPRWPFGQKLNIAVIADIHACNPWMSGSRVADIVAIANGLKPDVTVLLGDYVCTHPFVSSYVAPGLWAEALSDLSAPLGVFAILGNHDWWSAAVPTNPPDGSRSVRAAIAAARIPLLENQSVRLSKEGKPFWLIGLGDQIAFGWRRMARHGVDDLPRALNQVRDDAPAILLAHEPFIFPHVSERIALTLCGHTHGGQINLPLVGPVFAPTTGRGTQYIYGAYELGDKRLVVSGGLGTSYAPVRVLRPPEVVSVTVAAPGEA